MEHLEDNSIYELTYFVGTTSNSSVRKYFLDLNGYIDLSTNEGIVTVHIIDKLVYSDFITLVVKKPSSNTMSLLRFFHDSQGY